MVFLFSQTKNFKLKVYSSPTKLNICYYLKLAIPILHREFFGVDSQKPDIVKTHCNDRKNRFFACRIWIKNQ